MDFRTALADFETERDAATAFPGERRTLSGRFTGSDSRLVHVAPDGETRDFSYPLGERYGLVSARYGLAVGDDLTWFADAETTAQRTVADGRAVETTYDVDGLVLTRTDATLGDAHVATFALPDDAPADVSVVTYAVFAPEAQDSRVGQLVHDGAVEAYHHEERDFLASSTDPASVVPQAPAAFGAVLAAPAESEPDSVEPSTFDESRLTGRVSLEAPFEDGTVALATLLTSVDEAPRQSALDRLRALTDRYHDPAALRADAADGERRWDGPADLPESVATDLRVLELLSAGTGARIAGPEFDPYYQHSGGYGYTWFRDDSEIARFLLETDANGPLDLSTFHEDSARFYVDTQRADGRWPHRVWPTSGRLAPGWANAPVEGGERNYQADQSASALAFLAAYREHAGDAIPDDLHEDVLTALDRGLDGLDASLAADGLPEPCENAWENMQGRFTHTTATFLHAYSTLARTLPDADRREHARAQADRVYAALDDLWIDEAGRYALRAHEGALDDRVDVSTLALVDAHLAYARIGSVDDDRLARLDRHLASSFDGLWRETDAIAGLVRFEDDPWRRRDQDAPKVWTVATAWGAYAGHRATGLFADAGYTPDCPVADWADRCYDAIALDGPLSLDSGYMAEQFFDDGTPDSATPLGWPHAIRLVTATLREE